MDFGVEYLKSLMAKKKKKHGTQASTGGIPGRKAVENTGDVKRIKKGAADRDEQMRKILEDM